MKKHSAQTNINAPEGIYQKK